MNTSQQFDTVPLVRRLSLLMPLAEAIRAQLTGKEFAGLRRTEHGQPYIEARTGRGRSILAYIEDDLYVFETTGDKVACDPSAAREAVEGAVSRILDSARNAQA